MSNDLSTLDPDMLQTVSDGAKSSKDDIKLAMTQIQDLAVDAQDVVHEVIVLG